MAKIYVNQDKLTANFSLTADITGQSSVIAAIRKPAGTAGTSWTLTVDNESTGSCSFTGFLTTTFPTIGIYLIQPEVTFSDGKKIKGETASIKVFAAFD